MWSGTPRQFTCSVDATNSVPFFNSSQKCILSVASALQATWRTCPDIHRQETCSRHKNYQNFGINRPVFFLYSAYPEYFPIEIPSLKSELPWKRMISNK